MNRPKPHGPVSERFMRHHYGPSGYVKPGTVQTGERDLALLFASAQLAADRKTLLVLCEKKYTDYSVIQTALEAIEGTRKLVQKAIQGQPNGHRS